MGTKYTANNDTGYNSSPPPDDGTQSEANKVTWAKHKTKLTDPILQYCDDIDDDLVAHFDVDTLAKSANYTTVADDDGRVIECTSSPTITLGTAASMGAGYSVTIKTVSGTTTVNRSGSDTIDGDTSRTVLSTLFETYTVNNASNGYLVVGRGDVRNDVTAGNLVPVTDNTYDLGAVGVEWKDLYVDGTGAIDSLKLQTGATVNDIDTAMAGSPTDTQLLTAQGIKEYVDDNTPTYESSVATTSGSTVTIADGSGATAIPAGVRKMRLVFYGVGHDSSTNQNIYVQFGTGSTPTWVGANYDSGVHREATSTPITNGFGVILTMGTPVADGIVEFIEIEDDEWISSGNIHFGDEVCSSAGSINLAADVTSVRIGVTQNGGATAFDAGKVMLVYE